MWLLKCRRYALVHVCTQSGTLGGMCTHTHITNFWCLLKLMSIESVMPFNHLIPSCPLPLLPSIFPSIRVFSSESVLHLR